VVEAQDVAAFSYIARPPVNCVYLVLVVKDPIVALAMCMIFKMAPEWLGPGMVMGGLVRGAGVQ
jgi:hypothetical protein